MLRVPPTPYRSRATVAFRVPINLVSTAARRADGLHCDDAGCERMISMRKPSISTFISNVNSSDVCKRLGMTVFP